MCRQGDILANEGIEFFFLKTNGDKGVKLTYCEINGSTHVIELNQIKGQLLLIRSKTAFQLHA